MSSRLLSHDREEHGLAGRINRDFDRLKNFTARAGLDARAAAAWFTRSGSG
jgi:hypothetical protein